MPCLTDEQLTHFDEEGYLLVRGMLDVEEVIQPIIDELVSSTKMVKSHPRTTTCPLASA
ncbi:MAG: hypothetical protein J4F35_21375 [Candidatus Latescibacteria bacterium]|nr:hypothetical protein [Candidatus Latescibacterota bacterium]